MTNREYLINLMTRYTVDNLVNISPAEFERHITALPGTAARNVKEPEIQRTQNVKFVWGHNHDFGSFKMEGAMGNRHIDVLAWAMDELGTPGKDLTGKQVLDVGCWTGGTSLLLAGMGGDVDAIDEVKQYIVALRYLRDAFDISNVAAMEWSLYNLRRLEETYNLVCLFGILYHVSDPVLALRIAFNCLKDGGSLLLESAILSFDSKMRCEYRGPSSHTPWNWFVPSAGVVEQMCKDVGFRIAGMATNKRRALLHCVRDEYKPMLRAGLSRKDV